jgi:hypothetical protein
MLRIKKSRELLAPSVPDLSGFLLEKLYPYRDGYPCRGLLLVIF